MACRALRDVGVDVIGLVDCADTLFVDNHGRMVEELEFADFMDVVLQLRGSNTATVKDVVELRKLLRTQTSDMMVQLRSLVVQSNASQVGSMSSLDEHRKRDIEESNMKCSCSPRESAVEADVSTAADLLKLKKLLCDAAARVTESLEIKSSWQPECSTLVSRDAEQSVHREHVRDSSERQDLFVERYPVYSSGVLQSGRAGMTLEEVQFGQMHDCANDINNRAGRIPLASDWHVGEIHDTRCQTTHSSQASTNHIAGQHREMTGNLVHL